MKITIEANIPENEFMEGLLNMKYSGIDFMLQLSFYALAHRWHYDKFTYYFNLLNNDSSPKDKKT